MKNDVGVIKKKNIVLKYINTYITYREGHTSYNKVMKFPLQIFL